MTARTAPVTSPLRDALLAPDPEVGGRRPATVPPAPGASLPARVCVWATGVSLSLSSALVLVVLSRHLTPAALAQTSGVFVLALLISVPPVAVQGQAAACRARTGERAQLPVRLVAVSTGLLLVCTPGIVLLSHLPAVAVACPVLMLVPALSVAVTRGTLLGDGELGLVARSQALESAVRAGAAIGLGWRWGASGMALGLLLGSIAGAACLGRPRSGVQPLRLTAVFLGLATYTGLVNIDVLGAASVLGHGAAGYAASALPGKAVFLVLMAAGWLWVPVAGTWTSPRPAMLLAGRCLCAGLVLALAATAASPVAQAVLGQPHGPLLDAGLVATAMAVAGTVWACLMTLVGRQAGRVWLPGACAACVLLPVVLADRTARGLALGTLAAQLVALGTALALVHHDTARGPGLPAARGRTSS